MSATIIQTNYYYSKYDVDMNSEYNAYITHLNSQNSKQ